MYSLRPKISISISISRTRTWFFFFCYPVFPRFFALFFFTCSFFLVRFASFPHAHAVFFGCPVLGCLVFFAFLAQFFRAVFGLFSFFSTAVFLPSVFFFKGWFFLRVVFSRSVFYVESSSDEAQIELNTNTWLRNYKGQIESETIRENAYSPTIEITYRIT